jgi:ribosomal-protein-alanine N-acetyltransferase
LNFVAIDEQGAVAGYAMMWHVVNEGHINNIAVSEAHRRMGVGSLLMDKLFEEARRLEMIGLTLEVRVGNRAAMGLYNKYGFKVEGLRKNYYTDTKEDAAIMWKYMA